MTFAPGACARMPASMVFSRAGSVSFTNCSPAETAFSQELVESRTQVSSTEEKPASLPPMVTLTSVVEGLRAESWRLTTSVVGAPEHAANLNDAGELAFAHSAG